MICRQAQNGLGLDCGPAPAVPPGTFKASTFSSLFAPSAASRAQAAYAASITAYNQALARMNPSWSALPLAPYPPSTDTTSGFPQTGDASLRYNPGGIPAAALAEPGKITQNLLAQAEARRPKLNALFFVGACCLAGYLVIR